MSASLPKPGASPRAEFLDSASHALRGPLQALLGFSEHLLLQDAASVPPEQRELLDLIYKSAGRLSGMVRDALEVARLDADPVVPQPETVDATALARDVVVGLRPLAQARGLALALADAPARSAHTDPALARRIVTQLVSNAIKFTDAGSVTVTVSGGAGGAPVSIEVTDTGTGIAPASQGRIFQPFLWLHRDRREGSGLGLHLSQKLARALGGTIGFESEQGRGSRFWLTLPAAGRPS
jgi:signal transduction histidine kinase